ncbi:NAD-dependent epimerase/dehydratase family protein [Nocardioides dongxiaopingii]|uniref:polysaccharide biosynthesis protein n=1 Tax=Nocardioides sp. S-1144 TaxID=2582905 RepID=UPI00110F113C|nr:polysaccharide biosynthesis protein [Nocardioides sp. S-1144]QCW50990.1 NAD-dependent epimerase/dehydratase family protein [Nocardioides sp. S-1144]
MTSSQGPVLVTGGTGSFGSTMVRRLLDTDIEEVRILSRDESKQDTMRRELADGRVKFHVGDVRDPRSVEDAVNGVRHIFHAAALKQVPSCEFFPQQAVFTNVNGSDNVIRAAERAGVESVVCLSTDKAVYPINAMGISKAMMEKVAQAHARHRAADGPVVSITRYGNVMYSRGSVIPVFIEQIRQGRPLTVTDPRMTRFLMSLDESVDLVEYAFTQSEPGDLFVRKAPASTVEDLARAVASLFGDDDPEIRVIGTRHGEKLYESLLSREELQKADDHGDYYRVPLDARSLEYELFFDQGETEVVDDDYTSRNCERLDVEGVKRLLLQLPPVRRALAEAGRDAKPQP